MGGEEKGFITLEDYYKVFDESMPRCFDRHIALELFKELSADK
jgi:hypothetical protein